MTNGNGQGEGTGIVAVGEREGKVRLEFPKAVQWCELDPETARQVAEQLAKSAYTAHYGKAPEVKQQSLLAEQIRKKLHARATLLIRGMIEQGRKAPYIAHHVVDQILKEVT